MSRRTPLVYTRVFCAPGGCHVRQLASVYARFRPQAMYGRAQPPGLRPNHCRRINEHAAASFHQWPSLAQLAGLVLAGGFMSSGDGLVDMCVRGVLESVYTGSTICRGGLDMVQSDDWLAGAVIAVDRGGRPSVKDPRRQTRVIRLECSCGFTVNATSASAVREHGVPEHCGRPMHIPKLKDRYRVDPDTVLADLGEIFRVHGRVAYNDALREIGLADCIVREDKPARVGVQVTHRCQAGGCTRFTNGRPYCADHSKSQGRV